MELQEFLEDKGADHKLSATRLAMLLWALGVLAIWIYASLQAKALASIPQSVVTILGLVLGGKAIQRFGENSRALTLEERKQMTGQAAGTG